MERLRKPWRIKIASGGRSAGAKSWSAASLLVQRAHLTPMHICCFRRVQKSLAESAYQLTKDTIFRGLVDIRPRPESSSVFSYPAKMGTMEIR